MIRLMQRQQNMFDHQLYVILGKTYSSFGLHLDPVSSSQNHTV